MSIAFSKIVLPSLRCSVRDGRSITELESAVHDDRRVTRTYACTRRIAFHITTSVNLDLPLHQRATERVPNGRVEQPHSGECDYSCG